MSTATILWLSCSWTPLLIWWTLRNSARFKKNIVVGVTFPREAREDMQVKALLTSYRRLQLACAIVLVAAALGGAATGTVRAWVGSSMFCWSVWILVVCIVPEVIYALTNRRLAALKDERGWRPRGAAAQRVTVADIGAAAQSYPRVSSIWFVLICAASLVPVLLDRDNVVIYLLFAVCVLMMWAIFRWCYRNRSEVVDDNTALTQTLTRIRRRAWARVFPCRGCVFCLHEMGAAPLPGFNQSVLYRYDASLHGPWNRGVCNRDARAQPAGASYKGQRRGLLRGRGRSLDLWHLLL